MIFWREHNFGDTLKAFVHMCLYKSWIFGLCKNLKQILVGKEEESGEDKSFLLKIVI